jgi:hypothetical protein
MDQRLQERLMLWHEHLEVLRKAERVFLELEAHEDVLFSQLFLAFHEGSVEERKARARASQDWQDFTKGMVEAKARYLDEKRKLELKVKAYEAEYLTLKTDAEAMKRAG